MRSESLHGRFRSMVLLIAVILAAIVAVFVYHTARSHYAETGEASARAIVAAVGQTVAVGVYARDAVLLEELVAGLARHPSVSHVAIRDNMGTLLASKSAATNPTATGTNEANGSGMATTRPSFESALTSPFNALEPVGHIQVWLDSERLSADAKRQATSLVGALIVLLAGVLIVFNALASRLLSRPMHRLAGELARIEPGTSHRLVIERQHERDEVGVVTAAANRLLELQQHAMARERAMRDEIATMEARYRGIFDSTSAGIFVLCSQGRLLQANPALERLLGRAAGGDPPAQRAAFAHTAFREPSQLAQLTEAARASSQPEAMDLELVRDDGGACWVHCMVSVLKDELTHDYRVEGVLYDITQRRQQERVAQHRAEHDALTGLKSRAYIEASLDEHLKLAQREDGAVTLMFIDLDGFKGVNDRWGHAAGDAVLIESARRLRALFKRSCDSVGRLGGDELVVVIEGVDAVHPSVAEMATQLIQRFREPFLLPNGEVASVGASVGVASYPLHATSAKTLIHAADAAMYAVKQSCKGGFVIAVTDESAAAAERLLPRPPGTAAAAPGVLRDPLTGLPDRRQLGERLAAAQAWASTNAACVGVICVDLDQFKSVNLAHGPAVGDQVLCEAAGRIGALMRRHDSVARTGSDEFVVLVPCEGGDRALAARMAEAVTRKLLGALAAPIATAGGALTLRASAGVSLIDAQTSDASVVLREAQLALRRSKASSRNSLVFFEPDMMEGFRAALALEADLRSAIGTAQFYLHIQPQVDRDGALTGGEALLRWQHPVHGPVPPDQFISLAESCGAIIELGAWVLRAGCEALAGLRRHRSGLALSINVSPRQFKHPDFATQVREALAAANAPADGLILEITENLLIADIEQVTARLNELVAIGVRLSIDDFGTGFSSLAYLRHLPLYEIKIDRSFTSGLPQDAACAGIVRSILAMGSHLGLNVVAEGVETAAQSNFLSLHGCASQQGWLHGHPMPVADFLLAIQAQTGLARTVAPARSPHDPALDVLVSDSHAAQGRNELTLDA
jgi:diguanylate cyclase (GGDEF)-like protein/PAS domain S-box-containing protein